MQAVLKRRVDNYARENPEWNKSEAYQWIEAVLQEFERLHYLDDRRFAELKIQSYLQAGKPKRYIEIKLRQKGVDTKIVADILAQNEYDPLNAALKLAKRKKIGPYRAESMRREYRQKDMGVLVRAGFDYDTVQTVLEMQMPQEETLQ